MSAITAIDFLMESVGNGFDVADSFDVIVGTSTGGIIAFLIGLNQDSSSQAVTRYKQLINKIFCQICSEYSAHAIHDSNVRRITFYEHPGQYSAREKHAGQSGRSIDTTGLLPDVQNVQYTDACSPLSKLQLFRR